MGSTQRFFMSTRPTAIPAEAYYIYDAYKLGEGVDALLICRRVEVGAAVDAGGYAVPIGPCACFVGIAVGVWGDIMAGCITHITVWACDNEGGRAVFTFDSI